MRPVRYAAWLLLPLAFAVHAQSPWTFGPPQEVAGKASAGVFHHLESAGRKSIAAGDGAAAIVWEDNRGGSPQVYIASRSADTPGFSPARRLSGGSEAYEPCVVKLPGGGFFAGWEQDGRAVLAAVARASTQPLVLPGEPGSGQISLAAGSDGRVHVAWSAQTANGRRIVYAQVAEASGQAQLSPTQTVDAVGGNFDQLYPSLALSGDSVVVAWEDRRAGHTRIRFSRAAAGKGFAPSRPLNELPPAQSSVYGKGTGASRVALTSLADGKVAAVWADKRDFRSGYDVYAALIDGSGRSGPNERVQDEFGAAISQWHPAVAGAGYPVVAFDDDRDETPDVLIAWRTATGWSENLSLPGAAGPGLQSDPVIAVDAAGDLHVAWVYRAEEGGPTGIRYLQGRLFKSG